MKNYIYILPILFAAAACKNPVGDDFGVQNAGDYSVIYTVQALEDISKNTFTMMIGDETTVMVYANYGGLVSLGEDVKVQFKVEPELISVYNDEHGTSYRMMPDGSYATAALDVTIKKGERTSSPVTVSVDAGKFEGIGTYVLPLHIESVTPQMAINENLRTAFLFFSASHDSNPYSDIDRAGWSVAGFSTESTYGSHIAKNAIDDNYNSFWHTQWFEAQPGPPHHIDIDMGKTETIHGFRIRARTHSDGQLYDGGHPKSVEFYTKLNEDDEWTYQGGFEMLFAILDYRYLDYSAQARYFRLKVKSSYNNHYATCLSELYTF